MYEQLITKTFRDDAIRSAILIDDDFVTYQDLCQPGFSFDNLKDEKKVGSIKAASIHRFFQNKKISCDIDKGDEHIDVEKIRKSDLVIIDYHLEFEDPRKSLDLIVKLSKTEHMNLVVVYTREDLDKVWLSTAACLRGTATLETQLEVNDTAKQVWEQKTEFGTEIPDEWLDSISTKDLSLYAATGSASNETVSWFGKTLKAPGKIILNALCESKLSDFNHLKTHKSDTTIIGQNEEKKWLQVGNVFIVFHKKSPEDNANEPDEIWNAISDGLIAWKPTYYQLLISAMQNCLEMESISFSKYLGSDAEGQAAWLREVLDKTDQVERTAAAEKLFDRLTDELRLRVFENNSLREYSEQTFDALSQQFNETKEGLLAFVANHARVDLRQSLNEELGHALNNALCAREFEGSHITSGTVLVDSVDPNRWYLCVAPACETVPLQITGMLAKRLQPHRLMKVVVLETVSKEMALTRATESNFIFIKDRNKRRRAFSVLNINTHQPAVDYALVKNHDVSSKAISKNGIDVIFFGVDGNRNFAQIDANLIPVAQLRDIYTARFQSIASHHMGRIGVDYVNFRTEK